MAESKKKAGFWSFEREYRNEAKKRGFLRVLEIAVQVNVRIGLSHRKSVRRKAIV